jgi:hypothetical protein
MRNLKMNPQKDRFAFMIYCHVESLANHSSVKKHSVASTGVGLCILGGGHADSCTVAGCRSVMES